MDLALESVLGHVLGFLIGLAIALAFGGFGLFCLLVGLRGLRDDVRTWRMALASRHWTTTTATISRASIHVDGRGRRRTYIPEVMYRYDAGGQARTGTRLDFVSWGYHRWIQDEAEAALRPYPPGARVPVYVDPARPDVATLERRWPRGQIGGCLIVAVLLGVGAGLVTVGGIGLVDLARSWGGG